MPRYTMVAALFAVVGAIASVGVGLRLFDSGLAKSAPVAAPPSPVAVSPSPGSPEPTETKAPTRGLAIGEANAVQSVKDMLYNNYGYALPQSDRKIAARGRAACRRLGKNPTTAEIMFEARITSPVLRVPPRLGFVVLAALHWAFC
jgi:hypothetical protein